MVSETLIFLLYSARPRSAEGVKPGPAAVAYEAISSEGEAAAAWPAYPMSAARIEAGTRWWVMARDGPRYIAASVMPGK